MDKDVQRIEELHKRYGGVLYDKCLRMLGSRHDAEDAVQETFVNAYRALHTFRYGDSELPWLYRIATNVCLKQIRSQHHKREVAATAGVPETPVLTRPAEALWARRTLQTIVNELDERGQEIFVSHYIDGMDQGRVARQLGISRRAVVKRLTAMRARAEQLLGESE